MDLLRFYYTQNPTPMEDEDLFDAYVRTLKSYDISAHRLTLEKLDSLACTVGEYPIKYIMSKYLNYTAYIDNTQTQSCPATVYSNSPEYMTTIERIMAGL